MRHPFRFYALVIVLFGSVIVGCSSGSSSNTNNNGSDGGGGGGATGGTTRISTVVGRVTDFDGAPIVGATVTIGSLTAKSTQFGDYRIQNVEIPVGKVSQTFVVSATATVNGVSWSGSNVIETFVGDTTTNNAHLILSDPATQGAITGKVTNSSGAPLSGASVYASIELPPDPAHPTAPIQFSNLTSFLGITDSSGKYTIPEVPQNSRYLVVASYPGKLNAQQSSVVVNAGFSTMVNLSLPNSSGTSTSPTPTGLYAISLTYPLSVTRAASTDILALLRQRILQKKGWQNRHIASKQFTAKSLVTRDAPAGYSIENIITWDYAPLDNLLGYVVVRSVAVENDFKPYAIVQDALANRFSDSDTTLTPDILYYYSIARLDTINYPAGGHEGDPVIPPSVVKPLSNIALSAPTNGATISTPVFKWSKVNRATLYQILVYDRFPTLQSDFDLTNGVQPIWPADPNNPGASLVNDGSTSQTYQGPSLISGHTYYWTVLASDSVGSAYSISPLYKFTAN